MRILILHFGAVLMCLFVGCGNRTHANMQLAIADTVLNDQYAKEFNRLYPSAENYISYYTGDYGDPSWTSTVTINQKYRLTMQYHITIDSTGTKTGRVTEPHFYINIIESTSPTPCGGSETSFSGGTDFGPEGWKEIVNANGDVTVVISEDDDF